MLLCVHMCACVRMCVRVAGVRGGVGIKIILQESLGGPTKLMKVPGRKQKREVLSLDILGSVPGLQVSHPMMGSVRPNPKAQQ